jgi:hypothetical protein
MSEASDRGPNGLKGEEKMQQMIEATNQQELDEHRLPGFLCS